jgi:hypothetical protein
MRPDNLKINHTLAIFFGIGIAEAVATFVGLKLSILSLIYSIGLIVIIFNFSKLKEGKYIWEPGLGLIGIFALLYLLFMMIGYKVSFFEKLSASVDFLVWIRCIKYLSEDKDDSIDDETEQEINDEDGNIQKI